MKIAQKIVTAKEIANNLLNINKNNCLYQDYDSFILSNAILLDDSEEKFTSLEKEILSSILNREKNNYIFNQIELSVLDKLASLLILKAWEKILGTKHATIQELFICFEKKQLHLSKEKIINILFSYPNDEILNSLCFSNEKIVYFQKYYKIFNYVMQLQERQKNLISQYKNTIDYIEILGLNKKIQIIGKWQGENTRIIINNWEDIKFYFSERSKLEQEEIRKAEKEISDMTKILAFMTYGNDFEKYISDTYNPYNEFSEEEIIKKWKTKIDSFKLKNNKTYRILSCGLEIFINKNDIEKNGKKNILYELSKKYNKCLRTIERDLQQIPILEKKLNLPPISQYIKKK